MRRLTLLTGTVWYIQFFSFGFFHSLDFFPVLTNQIMCKQSIIHIIMKKDRLVHLKVSWNQNIAAFYYHGILIHLPTATLHNDLEQRLPANQSLVSLGANV